jgi:hypothetical protein
MHTCTRCTRCGRAITTSTSIARGMGRTCASRIRNEAATLTAAVKADTIAKAMEDIEDGAIIDTRRRTTSGHRIFAVMSSAGTGTYLATQAACTCRGGHRGRTCRHTIAARLIAA